MQDNHEKTCHDWRIPDALWERTEPLLHPRKPHPLGCGSTSRTAKQWTPSLWNASMRRASVPVVLPIVASKNGQKRTSSWPGGM